jgi:hypothetical protein
MAAAIGLNVRGVAAMSAALKSKKDADFVQNGRFHSS